MRRITECAMLVAVTISVLQSSPALAQGQSGLLGRLNPFRSLRDRFPARGNSPTDAGYARLQGGSRLDNRPNLDEIREALLERGIGGRAIDERIARIVENQQSARFQGLGKLRISSIGSGGQLVNTDDGLSIDDGRLLSIDDGRLLIIDDGRLVSVDDARRLSDDAVRTNLQQRGFTAAEIDTQISRLTAVRARVDGDRLGRGERAIGQFNLSNIRAQLQGSGLSTTEIDARIASLSQADDRSVGAIRSRLRERGLTESEVDRRIDRTVFGITSSSTPPTPVLFTRTRNRGR